MKYLLMILTIGLASCANGVKDWGSPDPNDSSMMAGDIMEPRHYTSGSIGFERKTMRDLTRDKDNGVKFSGELSLEFGAKL
jgi:hypothetical protein